MSNTSYSFKENSHMKEFQGGEKKVMKKILSVALSTAMAFSMFASVAFSAEKLTPQQQFDALKTAGVVNGYPDQSSGLERTITRAELATIIVKAIDLDPVVGVATYKDPNYTAGHWAAKYIEAATQAGILTGKDAVKQLFGPNDNLTVQELAVVLVKALKLEVPAETNNTATEWAKGYVQAAINEGLIESGINYQANATRSQAIVAAYAIWESNQIPTVASYEVSEAGKVVEFKLSNDDVVKVTLDEALVPNKETEVKFTHNGNEYTHKVTYVTVSAQNLDSVKADNLKQVVITFDGTVDEETAGDEDNYVIKDRSFHSATVSEDKTTVTLLMDNESASNHLTNQKEIELEVKNIKNEDGTKTFNQKVKFTPSDVTAPTVQEVTGLGTKAFKIKFSEPINPATALSSSSYKVDGKAIGASVKFAFPDTVIVETSLPVGEHKVAVSTVADYSGLKVAPVDNEFTVSEDTAAPEVVSAKTKDLKEVTIEFNETIKHISEVYANTTGNKAKITYEDTKVKLTFNNALNYSENTLTLKGVSDYSGNKADREVKVTPTLDTTRPTVSEVKLSQNADGRFIAELRFSEELDKASAEDKENYVLKNSEGKIADVSGVNSKGHPLAKPTLSTNKKVVSVDLGTGLKNEDYTLTITGVKDTAVVGNVILPVTVDLKAGEAQNGEIDRVWVEHLSGGEYYVYLEFNKELATSGDGNVYAAEKYTLIGTDGRTELGQLTDDVNDIDLIASKTVRIKSNLGKLSNGSITSGNNSNVTSYYVQASFIANSEGKYLKQAGSFNLTKKIDSDKIKAVTNSAKAVSRTEVKVEFESKVTNVNLNDFRIGTRTPINSTSSADQKTITFILDSDEKLPADLDSQSILLTTVANPETQNEYGTKIDAISQTIKDEIKPQYEEDSLRVVTATGATYELSVGLTESVKHNDVRYGTGTEAKETAYKLFEVKAEISGKVTYTGEVTDIDFNSPSKGITLTVVFKDADGNLVPHLGNNAYISVKFSSNNEGGKNIVDDKGNALVEFKGNVNIRN